MKQLRWERELIEGILGMTTTTDEPGDHDWGWPAGHPSADDDPMQPDDARRAANRRRNGPYEYP